jgi:benzoyl-CoA reductase/2-hydroxyglutaryl-CoA dehydratase subunit BcrC/BadD/HgdB
VKDWFQFYAREWNVPCLGIHTPRSIDALDGSLTDFVARQMEGLVEPLEQVAGRKLDIDRLREVLALSRQTTMLWKAVLEAAAAVPAPITFFDGTIHMGPAVVMRGLPEAISYYQVLVAELQERVAQGVAAVAGERLRLYWEGMPVWGKLSPLSNLFLEFRTGVVASTYCNSWIFEALDPADPFRSMARAYSSIFICRSDEEKQAYIEQMARRYQIHGIIYHDAKTCPNNSNNRYGLPQRLREKSGLPFLVINGDLNDLRLYSEAQTRTNIEAFIEQLLQG